MEWFVSQIELNELYTFIINIIWYSLGLCYNQNVIKRPLIFILHDNSP